MRRSWLAGSIRRRPYHRFRDQKKRAYLARKRAYTGEVAFVPARRKTWRTHGHSADSLDYDKKTPVGNLRHLRQINMPVCSCNGCHTAIGVAVGPNCFLLIIFFDLVQLKTLERYQLSEISNQLKVVDATLSTPCRHREYCTTAMCSRSYSSCRYRAEKTHG